MIRSPFFWLGFLLPAPVTLLLAVALAFCAAAHAGGLYDDTHDAAFRDAAIFLPPGTDWRLLKAQCYQESRFDPLAVSPVGAMGLCQFMPGTWADMQAKYPDLSDPWAAELSILAAGRYMGQLNRFWSSPRPWSDRYKLALASYNAGAGHLVKAQRIAGGAVLYDPIAARLPEVTGHHSRETLQYVRRIYYEWWPRLRMD